MKSAAVVFVGHEGKRNPQTLAWYRIGLMGTLPAPNCSLYTSVFTSGKIKIKTYILLTHLSFKA